MVNVMDINMPFPQNLNIANIFSQLGRADELGSGIRNIYKYYKFISTKNVTVVISQILANYRRI